MSLAKFILHLSKQLLVISGGVVAIMVKSSIAVEAKQFPSNVIDVDLISTENKL